MSTDGRHFSLGPTEGKTLFVLGDVVTFKVTAAESDNAYFLTEIVSVPGGGPAFLHTHIPSETFWVLEGEYEVYGQDENGEKYTISAPVGSTVHVAGNIPHGFKNVGNEIGKVLALFAPVIHQPEFFEEIGLTHGLICGSDAVRPDARRGANPRSPSQARDESARGPTRRLIVRAQESPDPFVRSRQRVARS